ncbi:hypothetical protein BZG78_05550 [Salinivibrio sp. MA351]|uniref:substrate-binding periplasmic protein n=1 Tax=unclassified Salinivibrio TaxID=2636825 RepID=UPI00098956E7|nr:MULTISPECIES: transporter substrate-binding domain-containing protein [unclassified Salinivibrio]OOF00256.1 hypothetical protein BZG78_05550 [Salinivibrio sp. MA351]OOF03821.1 hypothetical protein BZG81_10745 [Salinivibrio sp. MA607]OOF12746.1 hypothetical protein BZG79_09120 [Salinivibrio sp. MA427]
MRRCLIHAFFITIAFSACTYATENKTIIYAIPHWPPWSDTSEYPYQGIDVDVVNALANKIAVDVETVQCAWKRCLRLLETGKADIATNVLKRASRERYLYYLSPPYRTNLIYAFYTHKGSMISIKHQSDLYSYSVSLERGASFTSDFDNDSNITKRPVSQIDFAIKQLINQRASVVIGESHQIDYMVAKFDQNDVLEKQPLTYSEALESYIVLSKTSSNSHLKKQLTDALKQLVASGEITEIIDNHSRKATRTD